MPMKKLLLVFSALSLIFLLAACDIGAKTNDDGIHERHGIHERLVRLEDGRSVLCLKYSSYGLSCDWDNAR